MSSSTSRPVPWLTRVRISNFKSIRDCDVSLAPLTLLVGPNGAGKSNFLDAIRFLSEAVTTSPYQAVESRGGFGEILHRSGRDKAASIMVAADVVVPWGESPGQWATGTYQIEVGPRQEQGKRPVEVVIEKCQLRQEDVVEAFTVRRGNIEGADRSLDGRQIESDRLLLPALSVFRGYGPLFRRLSGMAFYHLEPSVIRQPAPGVENAVLGSTGEHLGDVLRALADLSPTMKQRIEAYLGVIVPGLTGIDPSYPSGGYVSFDTEQHNSNGPQKFGPRAMSDGTVRAAATLAALFQPAVLDGDLSLVGVEEPEIALHPGAAGVLFDALSEASAHTQIVATTQSADLFDRDDVDSSAIRVATFEDWQTVIGDLDQASQRILEQRLMTLGELMRGNQLAPRPRD